MAVLAVLLATAGCSGATIRSLDPDAGGGLDNPDSLFTVILRTHVSRGRVDYAALCEDDRLPEYLGSVSHTTPDTLPSADHRLAFWINAYNAWTLKAICDNYPVESINDLHAGGRVVGHLTGGTVWNREFVAVGDTTLSLNAIEHDIIRRRFDDPRIHFALVCAARSCPPLRGEAYTGEDLDAQLTDQARKFFSRENRFDVASKTAHLSRILDWYRDDFGGSRRALLLAIAPYAPPRARASIESDPDAWRVEYTDYDWSLNGPELEVR